MAKRKRSVILFKNPAHVAAAVQEPSEQYGPGSASYSPMLTPGLPAVGDTLTVEQMESPEKSTSDAPAVKVPRPPNPSVGGEPGRSKPLGYTIGLLPSRAMRQPFTGATLVRPTMGAHPATGPVGLSNRQGRLQAAVAALDEVYLPSSQQVREGFTQPAARNRNPLDEP